MWSTAREIAEGDLVIVWLTRDVVQPLVVESGKELSSKYGVYRHDSLIGVPYGSKIGSRNGKGFIHLLRPTPELWTLALPHRTQILYLADIAFITSWLDIKPGSRVIEAGTGSGSFSHSVARTIGASGHLWSYEFHDARANKARAEFAQHGMDSIVTLTHRNVCKDGFTVADTADSVFLDLPAPWDAVEHAKISLRKDRTAKICCFSPCMEQVQRTVIALNEAGFTDITMYETLIRPHQVDTLPSLPSISTISAQLKQAEARRERKRLRQIANAQLEKKRKRDDDGAVTPDDGDLAEKRLKTDDDATADDAALDIDSVIPNVETLVDVVPEENTVPGTVNVSKAFPEVRGHTSYLTFAVLLPSTPLEGASTIDTVDSAEATPGLADGGSVTV